MKKISLPLLCMLLNLWADAQESFNIKGSFSGVTQAEIFLYYTDLHQSIADSVEITNGLRGEALEEKLREVIP